jgi:membrane protein DedA with SNARE-associated domain
VSTFLFLGYHFGARWEEMLRLVERNLKEASLIAAVAIIVYAGYVFLRRRR